MTHTPQDRLNIYKEAHSQFQPSRSDVEDWERVTKEMIRKSKISEAEVSNDNKHCMT